MRADLSLCYACVIRGLPVVILAVLLCQPAPVRAQDRTGSQPLPPPPLTPRQSASASVATGNNATDNATPPAQAQAQAQAGQSATAQSATAQPAQAASNLASAASASADTAQPAPATATATVATEAHDVPAQPEQTPARPADTAQATPSPAPDVPPPPAMDMAMIHSVIATALQFLGPRTLEPHSSREFTLWGLGSAAALDPSLSFDTRGADIRLLLGQTPILSRVAPPEDDAEQWAQLATDFLDAARQHSAAVAAASREELLQAFFDELFNHLDPYSRYIGPSSATTDRLARVGGEADAGLTLTQSGTHIVIASINANGPAWAAPLDTGERIIAVNKRPTAGQSLETVREWLRGEPDSLLSLRLQAPDKRAIRTVSLRRAKVPPETVFAFASGSIVVLRVTAFSADTAEELSQYLDQAVQDKHLRGLIIDLRGNRGGVLQQAMTAAALLLDRGVAAITSGRDPQANHIWAVEGGDMTNGLPIAVLVDGRTASAAEILAAALADHRRAVVIGSATLGKGLVQTVAQLPDEGELFVTWSRVIAPLQWPLQGLGVMPQICTSLGALETGRAMQDLAAGELDNQPAVVASRAARYPVPVSRIMAIRRACPAALGTDTDLSVARDVLEHEAWYKTALAAIPDEAAPTSPPPPPAASSAAPATAPASLPAQSSP